MSYPTTPAPHSVTRSSFTPTLISVAHSLKRQVRARGAHRWSFVLKYKPMRRASAALLDAFLMAQRGQYVSFLFVPPVYGSSSGTVSGTVTVNGAHSAGVASVSITGLTGTLKAGDMIKFAGHTKVYMLTADGTTTLTIQPPLSSALVTAEAVTYNNVPVTVALASDSFDSTMTPANLTGEFEVALMEVV